MLTLQKRSSKNKYIKSHLTKVEMQKTEKGKNAHQKGKVIKSQLK
jgi:hypothetical protein